MLRMRSPRRHAVLENLSELAEKRSRFAEDPYFTEGLEDVLELGLDHARWFCRNHTMLMLKPDAVIARRIGSALEWLETYDFKVVGVSLLSMTRHSIRALWQYGWNAASRDRRDAADLYMTAGNCMLLLLAADDRDEPVSVSLNRAKGPADPDACTPGQLRHHLGSINFQLNFVHTPDEPADLLRELAILGDREERFRLHRYARVEHDATMEARELAASLEAASSPENLELSHVLVDITAAAEYRLAPGSPKLRHISALIGQLRDGVIKDWRPLLRTLQSYEVPVTRWQQVVLMTSLLDPHLPDVDPLLPDLSTTVRSP